MRLIRNVLILCLVLVSRGLVAQELRVVPPVQLGLAPDRLDQIVTLVEEAVDQEEVAGAVTLVARLGRVGHLEAVGWRDATRGAPMETDTLFRIASMTKAVTSVAAMQLYESGSLLLSDPVSRYLPEFADMQVLIPSGEQSGGGYKLEPASGPITIRHLLTHTSGLSYRFLSPPHLTPYYLEANISDGLSQTDGTVGEMVSRLARLPLLHEPGGRFTYSLGVDVLGRVIEVVTGQTLAEYMATEIFEPLGMVDTSFYRDPTDAGRYAAIATPTENGLDTVSESTVSSADRRTMYSAGYPYGGSQTYFSGGAGLTSTISDYARFLLALLNGGELDGVRILGRRTVQLMTRDHLVGIGVRDAGQQFGLGFAISGDPGVTGGPRSEGAFGWLGFFNTVYWVDPQEQLVAIIMTQLYPNNQSQLTDRFEVAVYSAIVN
ncbi:MAG: serine hydrolase domain-containing protein [Acidobacteriota bacterium]|nr:serine hydrolase domain-containing protein [Acidobacteriota bacterium]